MTYSDVFGMLPLAIGMFLFLFFVFKFIFKSEKKLMYKMLMNTILLSLLVVFIFSVFYLVIAITDMQVLMKQEKNNLTFDMLTSFDAVKNIHYDGNQILFYLDLFLYSSSVFFHTSFYYQIVGPGQIIVIFESAIGYILPLLIIILTYRKEDASNKEQIDVLRIYLSRGWNIFRVREGVIKDIQVVEIVSSDYTDHEVLYVSKSLFLNELTKAFTIKWDKINSINVLPYFAGYLEIALSKEDYTYSFKAADLFRKNIKNSSEYYNDFYSFLVEIRTLKSSFLYYESTTHIIKLLENERKLVDDNSIEDVSFEVERDE